MRKSQANRAVVAARASIQHRPVLAPSIDLRARPATEVKPSGFTGRRTRASMTGAQRNSEGRRSEWTMSQNNRDGRDRKWDATVSRG